LNVFHIQLNLYFVNLLQNNPKYQITSEIKPQIRFLSELDSLERKRHEEVERETLLRVAKVMDFLKY